MRKSMLLPLAFVACLYYVNAQSCRSGAELYDTTIQVPNIQSLQSYTIESWVRHDTFAVDGNQVLAWFDIGILRYRKSVGWQFAAWKSRKGGKGAADLLTCNKGWPSDGSYYHIAATAQGSTLKLYINGKELTAKNAGCRKESKTTLYSGTYFADAIGGHSSNSQNQGNTQQWKAYRWRGYIAEFRLWKVAQSASNIRANMRKRITNKNTKNIEAAWNFEETTFRPFENVPDITGKYSGTWSDYGRASYNSQCFRETISQIAKDLESVDSRMLSWNAKWSNENCSGITEIEAPCADLLQGMKLETFTGVDVIMTNENSTCKEVKGVNYGKNSRDAYGCGYAASADKGCSDYYIYNRVSRACACVPAGKTCKNGTNAQIDTWQYSDSQDVHFGTPKQGADKTGMAAVRFHCTAPSRVSFRATITDRSEAKRGKFNMFIDGRGDAAAVVDSIDSSMYDSASDGAFVEAGEHSLFISERNTGSIISDVFIESDVYTAQLISRVNLIDMVSSDAVLDLDPSVQEGTQIYDKAQGMRWRDRATSTLDGIKVWNLNNGYMQRQGDGNYIKIEEHYSHVYWVKWRKSNRGWRTGFRNNNDHCMIVRDGGVDLGVYSNRNRGFRDSKINIVPDQWNFVVVTGNSYCQTCAGGRAKFYIGTQTAAPRYRGASDRVCSGTFYTRLSYPGQGLGWVARAMAFDFELTPAMINQLYKETNPWGEPFQEVNHTDVEVNVPRPVSLSHPCKFGLPEEIAYLKNLADASNASLGKLTRDLSTLESSQVTFKTDVSNSLRRTTDTLNASVTKAISDLSSSIKRALSTAADSTLEPTPDVDCSDCDNTLAYRPSIKGEDGELKVNLPKGKRLQVFNGKSDEILSASDTRDMLKNHVRSAFSNALNELD